MPVRGPSTRSPRRTRRPGAPSPWLCKHADGPCGAGHLEPSSCFVSKGRACSQRSSSPKSWEKRSSSSWGPGWSPTWCSPRPTGRGAHINPAVTRGPLLAGDSGLSFAEVLVHLAGQMVGAMIGATLCWVAHVKHFDDPECEPTEKLAVFCAMPTIAAPLWNVATEVFGRFVLVLVILSFGKTPPRSDRWRSPARRRDRWSPRRAPRQRRRLRLSQPTHPPRPARPTPTGGTADD